MKTLHELAIEYAKSIYQEEYDDPTFAPDVFQTKNDFAAGYKAAKEWISVEDELPQYTGQEFPLLLKDSSGEIFIGYIEEESDITDCIHHYTHWRPINND